jgi:hypothetical protein
MKFYEIDGICYVLVSIFVKSRELLSDALPHELEGFYEQLNKFFSICVDSRRLVLLTLKKL